MHKTECKLIQEHRQKNMKVLSELKKESKAEISWRNCALKGSTHLVLIGQEKCIVGNRSRSGTKAKGGLAKA